MSAVPAELLPKKSSTLALMMIADPALAASLKLSAALLVMREPPAVLNP